jgi:hypothetical protein
MFGSAAGCDLGRRRAIVSRSSVSVAASLSVLRQTIARSCSPLGQLERSCLANPRCGPEDIRAASGELTGHQGRDLSVSVLAPMALFNALDFNG